MIAVTYDAEADTTYVYLRDGEVDKTYIHEQFNVDIDANGAVLGVEFFGTPGALRTGLQNDLYDELWTDLFEFARDF